MRMNITRNPILRLVLWSMVSLISFGALGQVPAQVSIDLECQRYIGDVSELDRTKFFNMHSSHTDLTMSEADFDTLDMLGVGYGRSFWGPFASKGKDNPYPDEATAISKGATNIANTKSHANYAHYSKGTIVTEHPYNVFKRGMDPVEAADWAATYFKTYYDAETLPYYYEPMNEPFVHSGDDDFGGSAYADSNREEMIQLLKEIGKKFDEEGIDTKILGYGSAWPSQELWDFGHFNSRLKMFMDSAGPYTDAISIHLYDGINVTGANSQRSGSNSNAILDLVETYSNYKWDSLKPHFISEYGGIEDGYPNVYSDIKSIQSIKAINHILFNLLEREDRLMGSIPFITGRANWYYSAENDWEPYGAVLWRPDKTSIVDGKPTKFIFTSRVNFYKQWQGVEGSRVRTESDNEDILVQTFVKDNKAYVCLNSLAEENTTVDLNFVGALGNITNVESRALKIYVNDEPEYIVTNSGTAPASLEMVPDETVVLVYTFDSNISFNNSIRSKQYYSDDHLKTIVANTPLTFNFSGVEVGTGKADLRMSIGRKHAKSKNPVVTVNGHTVPVPDNWEGGDQIDRDDFFGLIRIPVPMEFLAATNVVDVTFPDSEGRVSTMVLNIEKYDAAPMASNPFWNEPVSLPAVLNAEEFDLGVEGVAYHDSTATNDGNAAFRTASGVDINDMSGDYYVTDIQDTEWLNYQVYVPGDGDYILKASVAGVAAGAFHWEMDGATVGVSENFTATGTPGSWVEYSQSVTLTKGIQTLSFVMESGEIQLDEIEVVSDVAATGIMLSVDTMDLKTSRVYDIEATINPYYAGNNTINWTSSDESVLTVDSNGQITADGTNTGDVMVIAEIDGTALRDTAFISVIPRVTESVAFYNLVDYTLENQSFTFELDYVADSSRFVNVELKDPSDAWKGAKNVAVPEGSGRVSITLTLGAAQPVADNYKVIGALRTVGNDWKTNVAAQVDFFDIKEAPTATFVSVPDTVVGSKNFSAAVAYEINEDRDLFLALKNSSGDIVDSLRTSITTGSDTAFLSIVRDQVLPAGAYTVSAEIREINGGSADTVLTQSSPLWVNAGIGNIFENTSFETGDFTNWTPMGASVEVIDLDSIDGWKAVHIDGVGSVTQQISVEGGKTYLVKTNAKVMAGTAYLGAKNHGAAADSAAINDGMFTESSFQFTVGAAATTADVFFSVDAASEAYVDAFSGISIIDTVHVTGIAFETQSISLEAGRDTTIVVDFTPADATDTTLMYTSLDPDYATVDGVGNITAIKQGTARIVATAQDGGFADTLTVNTFETVDRIEFINFATTTPRSNTIGFNVDYFIPVDRKIRLDIYDADNAWKGFAQKATVTAGAGQLLLNVRISGNVPPPAATGYKVVVRTMDGSTNIETNEEVFEITPLEANLLEPNDGFENGDLKGWVSWGPVTVVNSDAASGDYALKVTGNSATFNYLEVEPNSVYKFSVDAKVVSGAGTLSVAQHKNGTETLEIPFSDGAYHNYEYNFTTGDTTFADVAVKMSAVGEIYFDNVSITKVVDTVHVTGVTLASDSIALAPAGSETVVATIAPANATDQTVLWSSMDTTIATVDASGLITAKALGITNIIATSQDGDFTDTVKVNVANLSENISFVYVDTVVIQNRTFSAKIDYYLLEQKDVSLELFEEVSPDTWQWRGGATQKTLDAGSGEVFISVHVGSPIAVGNNYKLSSSIRNVGGNFETNTVTIESPLRIVALPDSNIIANGDFESGDIYHHRFWGGPYIMDTTDVYEGDYSVKMTKAGAVQYFGAAEPNTTYRFTAYAKKLSGTAKFTLLNFGGTNIDLPITSSTYTEYSTEFTTGAATSVFQLNYYLVTGTGEVYADNFKVEKVVPVTGINLPMDTLKLYTGVDSTLMPMVLPANANDKSVSWTSDNHGVATVDVNGNISAVAEGMAKIIATTTDGSFKDSVIVTVKGEEAYLLHPPRVAPSLATYVFKVNYHATASRDLLVVLNDSANNWVATAKKVVPAGTGITNVSLTVQSGAPAYGSNYKLVTMLRPEGGVWEDNLSLYEVAFDILPTDGKIENQGFELGAISGWSIWNNAFVQDSVVHEGTYAVEINDQGSVSQTINVRPNTKYILSTYGKVDADGQVGKLGVNNYGGADMASNITSTTFEKVTRTFTTGPSNKTANIYLYLPSDGHKVYADSFSVEVLRTEWDGGSWSDGAPDMGTDITIKSDVAPGSFTCYNLTIESGRSLHIPEGEIVTVTGNLINNGGGFTGKGKIKFAATGDTLELDGDFMGSGVLEIEEGTRLKTNGQLTLEDGGILLHNGDDAIEGEVVMKRTGNTAPLAYNYWSIPVMDGKAVNDIGGDHRYIYDEPSQQWNSLSGADSVLAGQGMIATGAGTVNITGTPFADSVRIETTYQGVGAYKGYNLIGNPFLAPLDYHEFISDNPAIKDGVLYLYEGNADGSGNYQVINAIRDSAIATFQGFFVQVEVDTAVHFYHAHKTTNGNDGFARKNAQVENQFLLQVKQGDYKDRVRLVVGESFSNDTEYGYDAEKFYGNQSLSIAFDANAKKWSMVALATAEKYSVPVALTIAEGQVAELSIADYTSLNKDFDMYLINDHSGEIKFFEAGVVEILSSNQNGWSLEISKREKVLSIGDELASGLAYKATLKGFEISNNTGANLDMNVRLINMEGREIWKNAGSVRSGNQSWKWNIEADKLYIIQIEQAGKTSVQKVVFK